MRVAVPANGAATALWQRAAAAAASAAAAAGGAGADVDAGAEDAAAAALAAAAGGEGVGEEVPEYTHVWGVAGYHMRGHGAFGGYA